MCEIIRSIPSQTSGIVLHVLLILMDLYTNAQWRTSIELHGEILEQHIHQKIMQMIRKVSNEGIIHVKSQFDDGMTLCIL